MEEIKLTLPEGVNVEASLDTNEETGNSRLTILSHKAKLQYVGKIESQEKLDFIVDTLLYTANF